MTAVDGLPGQKKRWLNPRATWTVTVTQPVKVVAEGQFAVDLVTDTALDPVPAGIIPLPNLYARKASSGMTVQCDFAKMTATTTVPLCFEKILVIDGKEYSAGSLFYRRTANSRSSGSAGSNAHFASPLAPTITTADVILRPDPIYAENFQKVNEIWGKEIIFRNVPIERFDLQD
jgi:hypothetical protein